MLHIGCIYTTIGLRSYQAVEKDEEVALLQAESQEIKESSLTRSRVLLSVVAVVAVCAVLVFQSGVLSTEKQESRASFAAAVVRAAGEPYGNGDEQWPCYVPSGSTSCSSNYYTAVTAPYKLVFYNGDIKLYMKSRATAANWPQTFTTLAASGLVSNWGAPYFSLKDYLTTNLNSATAKLQLQTKTSSYLSALSTATSMTYTGSGSAAKSYLNFYNGGTSPAVIVQTYANAHTNCDLVQFILGTDGNLILKAYQSSTSLSKYGTLDCSSPYGPLFCSSS